MDTLNFLKNYPTTEESNISDLKAPGTQPDNTDTVLAWLLWYINKEVASDRSKHTREAKTTDLQKFLNYFIRYNPEGLLSQWDAAVTNGFIEALDEMNYKTASIKRILSTLITFAHFLELKKAIDPNDNPTRKAKSSKIAKARTFNSRPVIIKRAKDQKVLHEGPIAYAILYEHLKAISSKLAYPKRDIALFSALLHTGLRVSELCNLKRTNLNPDPETGGFELLGVTRKGGGKEVENPPYLDADATIDLNDYINSDRETIIGQVNAELKKKAAGKTQKDKPWDSEYVFLSSKGNKLSRFAAWEIVKKIGRLYEKHSEEKVIVEIHPHRLRHGRARLLIDSGFTESEVAAELGHSDNRYVGVYTKETPSKHRKKLNDVKIPLVR